MDDVGVLRSSATRHSCKVCGKGFPCGRSLGGHMRSHSLAEVAAVAADDDDDERQWIQSGARGSSGIVGAGGGGYGLRENPKKTRRLSESGGDEDGRDACHDHGELFSSCRSVLGHVRRHTPGSKAYAAGEDVSVEVEEGPEEEEMLLPSEAAVVMAVPSRRRRLMRLAAPGPPSTLDAFDKEPEDVALCLIMLSRDTTGLCGLTAKDEYWPEKDKKKKRDRLPGNGYYHDADSDDNSALLQYADTEFNKSKKRKTAPGNAGEKRSRYECPGCGRAFQSYQALGGHRASHKRINSSCCIAKVAPDQPEPSVETNASFSTPASPDVDAADIADRVVAAVKAKKVTKFECPICFKVFGSGQALGGHKRSHSIACELYERAHPDGDAGIVDPEQSLISAGFLDLNLPAPGAED